MLLHRGFSISGRRKNVISQYDIGDTVILCGTIQRIEQGPDDEIRYILREYDRPIREETILGSLQEPWKLLQAR